MRAEARGAWSSLIAHEHYSLQSTHDRPRRSSRMRVSQTKPTLIFGLSCRATCGVLASCRRSQCSPTKHFQALQKLFFLSCVCHSVSLPAVVLQHAGCCTHHPGSASVRTAEQKCLMYTVHTQCDTCTSRTSFSLSLIPALSLALSLPRFSDSFSLIHKIGRRLSIRTRACCMQSELSFEASKETNGRQMAPVQNIQRDPNNLH